MPPASTSAASTSKDAPAKADAAKPADEVQQQSLGILEEDDEFEEFPAADWDDAETDLAHLGGAAPGAAKTGGDKLWEDNWDDDDVEEDFSVQLRGELTKTSSDAMEQ
ncbi:DSS1/SEM1 family-domain-containing protein [Coprinopsis sp. MPI-PUGE-AT-0042]|nr:DSS1/SEM1 family-domain-containing protein [Coprinopsis sp. MPI-PUGE-AT-0042]